MKAVIFIALLLYLLALHASCGAFLPAGAQSEAPAAPVAVPVVGPAEKENEFYRLIKRAADQFAAAHYDQAKKIYEEAVTEGKKAHVNKADLAVTLGDIALIDKLTFQLEAAQDCLMDALPLAGDDDKLLSFLLLRLSSVMRARGNIYGAIDKAKSSVEIRRKIDPQGISLVQSLNNVAVLSLELKNNKEAIDYCDQALAVLKQAGEGGAAEEAAVLSTKAACLSEDGDYRGARTLLVQVLASQEKIFGNQSPKLSSTLNNMAMTYSKQNNYKEAEPFLMRALQSAESSKPQDIPGAADASANLADLYARMGDHERAERNFKKAIEYGQTINYRHLKAIKDQYQSFLAGEIHPAAGDDVGKEKPKADKVPPIENRSDCK